MNVNVKFKIDKNSFPKSQGNCGMTKDEDVVITLRKSRSGGVRRLALSIKSDLAVECFPSARVTANICKYAGTERLYILESEEGFRLNRQTHSGSRWYVTVNIASEKPFYKYIGGHALQFDDYNNAYYVEL